MNWSQEIDQYFGIAARGSTVRTEILAGVSTFLALSYIFVVNPAILAQGGFNPASVLFATVVASASGTLAMGLWGRLPFVLAPGMEMNAYVAFFVIGNLGFSWQQALGAVFWSGVIFLILTVTRVRQRIIDAIPDQLKVSLALSVGVFLILVALRVAGVLTYDGVRISGVGTIISPLAGAMLFSLGVALVLERFHVRAAVLLSILSTTLLCHALGIGMEEAAPTASTGSMLSALGALDLRSLFVPGMMSAIIVLFLIDFYGSIAKLVGLSLNTSILQDGQVPRLKQALLIDGAVTTGGAILGTSSLTVYVESGVGIGVGGRTGLTAVTCGLLMLAALPLAPLLGRIPVIAATGALMLVGVKLVPTGSALRSMRTADRLTMVLMAAIVVGTFALDRAMLAGLLATGIAQLLRHERLNPYLVASCLLLLVGTLLQGV